MQHQRRRFLLIFQLEFPVTRGAWQLRLEASIGSLLILATHGRHIVRSQDLRLPNWIGSHAALLRRLLGVYSFSLILTRLQRSGIQHVAGRSSSENSRAARHA